MTDQKHSQKQKRLCDYCNQSTALLYCRADSAKLCFSCDREVHSANQLFSRHSRSQLCDVCDKSPASIFCENERSVFCPNCDWENHKFPFSSVHNRRPIEGFTGCPSVNELVIFFGIEDLGHKALFLSEEKVGLVDGDEDNGLFDLLNWEPPVISGFDDLLVSSDFDHGFKSTDVPPLPKNRHASCGQHKEEMFHQLRELARSEPSLSFEKTDVEAIVGFQSSILDSDNLQPGNLHTGGKNDKGPISFPDYELRGYMDESAVVPDNQPDSISTMRVSDSLEVQLQHQNAAGNISALPKVAFHELNSQERDFAISRYKEKKKTRRYDKHVRYESRKVRAENRTRIKGRFAKVEH